jgi:hypothetical protein
VGPASQTSFTPDLTKRPPSAHRTKLSASLLPNIVLKSIALKNIVLKNIVLKNVGLQKLLLRSVVFLKIVSSNAVLFNWMVSQ